MIVGNEELKALLGDRYVLGQSVGRGAFSNVYFATANNGTVECAVKVMDLTEIPENERGFHYDLFLRESQILQQLEHPGIPKFIDFFTEKELMVLVTEYVHGVNLDEFIARRRAPLSEIEVLDISLQICGILEYLHSEKPAGKIIYRDLKPSNLIIDENGKIKLIDFATARIYSPEKKKDTIKLGTPGFAAPEAYGNAQTDERADVFSLGATMFHLLTGDDPEKYMFQYPPLRKKNPALSEYVQDIVLDSLKSKEERTADITIMKGRIRNLRDTLVFMKEFTPGSLFFRLMFAMTQFLRMKLSFTPSRDFTRAGIVLFLLCVITPVLAVFLTVKYPSGSEPVFTNPVSIGADIPADYQRKKMLNILENKFSNFKLYCDLKNWDEADNAWADFFAFSSPFQEVMSEKFRLYPQAVEIALQSGNSGLAGNIFQNTLRDYEIYMNGEYLGDPSDYIKKETVLILELLGENAVVELARRYMDVPSASDLSNKTFIIKTICNVLEEKGNKKTSIKIQNYFEAAKKKQTKTPDKTPEITKPSSH
jgi:serine/threonine protein kinase